jgi:hypothetical protein
VGEWGAADRLSEESIKLPAGGIERALLLFFRFHRVDQKVAFVIDPIAADGE